MEDRAKQFKEEGNKKFKLGKYQEAVKDYTTAISYATNDATLYSNRSASWFMLKAYKQTVEDCLTALKHDPAFTKARQRVVKAFIHLGEFSKAKEHINYILSHSPGDDTEALKKDLALVDFLQQTLNEAESSFNTKKYSAALSSYSKLEQHATACDAFLLKQIEAQLYMGNYGQVIRDSLQIIKADQSNSDAYYLRAKGLYYMENYDQAISHLQECLRLNPDHNGAARDIKKLRQIVRSMKAASDAVFVRGFEEAVKHYTDTLEVDKENTRLNAKLLAARGEARFRMGDLEHALEDCRASIKLVGDTATPFLTHADVCIQMGKYDEAISTLERVLQHIEPSNSVAMQKLQDAQFLLKKEKRTNYYELLGVMSVASQVEIRDGYKQKAMEWHPDKHSASSEEQRKLAEQTFKKIQEGYEVLSDPFKKDLFDKGYDLDAINEQVQMQQAREKKRKCKEDGSCGGCSH